VTIPVETPTEEADVERGECPVCHRGGIRLRKDGRLNKHSPYTPEMAKLRSKRMLTNTPCSGRGKKPVPPEREFIVRGTYDFQVKVTARTADEAAELLDDSDYDWWSDHECLGYGVDEVVSVENEDKGGLDNDERQMCQRERCGHPVLKHTGRWNGIGTIDKVRLEHACDEIFCKCTFPLTPDEDDE
jgi:hypothetical protein